jgi:FXSXX-COOH protein
MMTQTGIDPTVDQEVQTQLPDLSDLSLEDLMTIDSPALREILEAILEEDEQQEIVAGFQSALF